MLTTQPAVNGLEFLSNIIAFSKYAQWLKDENRRETRTETINRFKDMLHFKYPDLREDIEEAFTYVHANKFYPSMRGLQFGGEAILKRNHRIYNCAYMPAEAPEFFRETMYILLGGVGLGYSVRKHHVEKLPKINIPTLTEVIFEIPDSVEGWADAYDALVMSYFVPGSPTVIFDGSKISKLGTRLNSGIIAPGPDKLLQSLESSRAIFDKALANNQPRLRPIDVHDIACHAADCVVSGGVRRSAMIVLFSWDDEEMLNCKLGDWWDTNPQRARANNSVAINKTLPLEEVKKQYDFARGYLSRALRQGYGDPAIIFTSDDEYGFNPCAEANLYYSFCCLVEIIAHEIKDQEEFEKVCKWASFVATLQAGFTDFKYLRPIWKIETERQALVGNSFTSYADSELPRLDLTAGAEICVATNEQTAHRIGINPAHRVTVVKPAGTSTLFSKGHASGAHDPVSKSHYLRRMRVGKNEAIYYWLVNNVPALIEDAKNSEDTTAVLTIPIRLDTPEKLTWADTEIEFLERVRKLYREWIVPGHKIGPGTNNVSATVSVRSKNIDQVLDWIWDNREDYVGMSVFPAFEFDADESTHSHSQLPLQPCSEELCAELERHLVPFSAESVYEPEDLTALIAEAACAGGACEIVRSI
jgi:ribonucleoside-diphosphate reductase alpha chain